MLSESMEGQPAPARWLTRFVLASAAVVRVIILLQAVGGLVGLAVGVVTLDGRLVLGGLMQLALAGFVFGFGLNGFGGTEHVVEASGPAGAFVIRTSGRRHWRDLRGFVSGRRTWRATVRRRQDDPFGAGVLVREAPTERQVVDEANRLAAAIRNGEGEFGTPRP